MSKTAAVQGILQKWGLAPKPTVPVVPPTAPPVPVTPTAGAVAAVEFSAADFQTLATSAGYTVAADAIPTVESLTGLFAFVAEKNTLAADGLIARKEAVKQMVADMNVVLGPGSITEAQAEAKIASLSATMTLAEIKAESKAIADAADDKNAPSMPVRLTQAQVVAAITGKGVSSAAAEALATNPAVVAALSAAAVVNSGQASIDTSAIGDLTIANATEDAKYAEARKAKVAAQYAEFDQTGTM